MKIAGIIGYPLGHSLSPAMHNAAFRQARIQAMYLPFEVNEFGFEVTMQGFRAMPFLGLNVTLPYKQAVTGQVDRLDPLAERLGAVNTVVRRGRQFVGYNTDSQGFWEALPSLWKRQIAGSMVLLLGAGGSARALADILGKKGARRVVIANRTEESAVKLARIARKWNPKVDYEGMVINSYNLKNIIPLVQVMVHATSVGLGNREVLPLPSINKGVNKGLMVFDLQYHAPRSPLRVWANKLGYQMLDGKEMLVQQGALAWTMWTHRPAPLLTMRRALIASLRSHG